MTEESKTQNSINNHWPLKTIIVIIAVIIILGGIAGLASIFTSRYHYNGYDYLRNNRGGHGMMARHISYHNNSSPLRLTGDVTAISGSSLTLVTSSQTYTVNLLPATSYIKNREVAKESDLRVNNTVSVIGSSDSQGAITATTIIIH